MEYISSKPRKEKRWKEGKKSINAKEKKGKEQKGAQWTKSKAETKMVIINPHSSVIVNSK